MGKKWMKINEESLREISDTIKHAKIHAMVVSEREKRDKKRRKIFKETIAENYPNLLKNNLHI